MNVTDKNLKIRIVSFQNAHNFGAVLQAYCLQQTLLCLGFLDVKFINYNPEYLKNRYKTSLLAKQLWAATDFKTSIKHSIKRFSNLIYTILDKHHRNILFKKSIRALLNQTQKELHDSNDFCNEPIDVLICGSDQIWNKGITQSFDSVYFGHVNNKFIQRKIAYAASAEISNWDKHDFMELISKLDSLDSISVREVEIRDKLALYATRSISVNLDPTLICPIQSVEKIVYKRITKKPYILVYSYNKDFETARKMITTIPNCSVYEVHYILFSQKTIDMALSTNGYYHSALTIMEFLSLFKYADYVITNSFHGLCFSLRFHKNFNAFITNGMNGRLANLLTIVNLPERNVRRVEDTSWESIDYDAVEQSLEPSRKKSLNYLLTAINK